VKSFCRDRPTDFMPSQMNSPKPQAPFSSFSPVGLDSAPAAFKHCSTVVVPSVRVWPDASGGFVDTLDDLRVPSPTESAAGLACPPGTSGEGEEDHHRRQPLGARPCGIIVMTSSLTNLLS
jgi:hypothetical protein